MNKDDFFIEVKNVFKNYNGDINFNSSPSEVEDWDSMGHLNLIMSMEKKYNITIEFEEAIMIDNLESLFNLVNLKLK
jgi:acyl carrier protein